MEKSEPKTALVLSGGGARGAYEAGVVQYIRTKLPPEIAESTLFNIYSGTSVGAINCAYMASTAHDPVLQGKNFRKLWLDLTSEDIYYADVPALLGVLIKTGFFTATNFFGLHRLLEKEGKTSLFSFKSILDTTPFYRYMRRTLHWGHAHRSIQQGIIDALTVSATPIMSGHHTLFVEKAPGVVYRAGGPQPIYTTNSPKHILA